MNRLFTLTPASITLIYFLVAIAWIFGLGYLVVFHTQDPVMMHRIELLKGAVFVALTATILYWMVRTLRNRLEHTSSQLRATLDAIPDLMFELDLEGRYYYIHSTDKELLAAPQEELVGKSVRDVLSEDAAAICMLALQEANEKGFSHGQQFKIDLEGERKWFELSISRKPSVPNAPSRFIVLSRDITERKNNEEKIIRLSQLYAALSQCNQAIARSQSEEELFPMICADAVRFGGMSMAWIGIDRGDGWLSVVSFDGNGTGYLKKVSISTNPHHPTAQGPTGRAFHLGESYWCQDFQHDPITAYWHEWGEKFGWGSSAALPLRRHGKVIGVFTLYALEVNGFNPEIKNLLEEMVVDINYALDGFANQEERRIGEEKLHYLANFDPLTGLPNRTRTTQLFNELLQLTNRNSANLAVMLLDLDRFKDINDSLGHSVGDALLLEVSLRLQSFLRSEESIARFGGDEFVLILPDSHINASTQVAQKLLDGFEAPFSVHGHLLNISVSIGIAVYPNDGEDFEILYKNADAAMYRAKQEGRNGFCFFTQDMQEASVRTLELSNALRHALERNELELYYQPQISTIDGKLIGAEALLRWHSDELGTVSPAEFIPIAEENGTIIPIGEWVLRTAITQAKTWLDQGYPPILIAVNLSAAQFRASHLPSLVETILMDVGLPSEYLELELTESMAMQDPKKAIDTMNLLHHKGIRMSIDDFGTGYSSLSYLKKFNIYKLKIDQSFIRDINIDSEDKAIVAAVISMAKSLGLTTIAEGVETIGQLEYLKEQGCDEIQGYYYSKPLRAEAFEEYRNLKIFL